MLGKQYLPWNACFSAHRKTGTSYPSLLFVGLRWYSLNMKGNGVVTWKPCLLMLALSLHVSNSCVFQRQWSVTSFMIYCTAIYDLDCITFNIFCIKGIVHPKLKIHYLLTSISMGGWKHVSLFLSNRSKQSCRQIQFYCKWRPLVLKQTHTYNIWRSVSLTSVLLNLAAIIFTSGTPKTFCGLKNLTHPFLQHCGE